MYSSHTKSHHPLRILQVNTQDIGGGAAGSAWNIFDAYRRRGLDSCMAVGQKFSTDPAVYTILNERFRPIWTKFWHKIQNRITNEPTLQVARFTGKVAWFGEPMRAFEHILGIEDFHYPGTWNLLDLTPQKPTIVHCHNLHGGYFDLRILPWLSKQVPTIINLRDTWLLSGHCALSLGCERWMFGCGNCPDLTIYPEISRDSTARNWRRKQAIFKQSHLYITAPSKWLVEQAQKSMLNGVEYRIIPNAIDLEIFHLGDRNAARAELGLPEIVVLFFDCPQRVQRLDHNGSGIIKSFKTG